METQCIAVPTSEGQRAIGILKNADLLDTKFRIESDENYLYLPVVEITTSQKLLQDSNIPAHVTFAMLEHKKTRPKSIAEVLHTVIPENLWKDIPSSFDIIGDKIVVEIKPSLNEFEADIGMAFMFVHPSVTSVYRKEGAVSGSYRIRPVRLIAGKDEPLTIHREYGLAIVVDVSKVYFSPRLSTEHARVASLANEGERILDMFCGVGSFPLHIAKNVDAEITAIDLNPDAIECLKKSIALNRKTLKGRINPIQSDI
ncbi:MAG: class I SAM-dependent methyltransferase family protein, partial [Methanobacteriota archaeon]